jgi:2-polyprenyl-6-methoxyphenol hydroxylase-like FAD-dependent oxidoreductase
MLLARRGQRVLVLDRASEGSDTLSTHALLRPGVVQLRRWGLLDAVVASGAPPIRRTIVHYGDEAVPVSIKARNGVDAFYAPRRTALDSIIVRAAREAGADVRFGVTVTGLLRDIDGRVSGVEARDGSGASHRFNAPITIGADGVRSLVARGVEAPTYWQGTGGGAVVYAYFAGLDGDHYERLYRPGASGALIPTNGGLVNVSALVPSDRFAREIRHDVEGGFWRALGEAQPAVAARIARAERTTRFRSFPGLASFHRQPWGPGWALVGDAGSFMDPIGAHGISTALRDAELLARAVLDVHTGAVAEEQGLGSYQQRRDDLSRTLFEAIDHVSTHRWDLDALRERLMQMSAEMTREAEALVRLDESSAAGVAA